MASPRGDTFSELAEQLLLSDEEDVNPSPQPPNAHLGLSSPLTTQSVQQETAIPIASPLETKGENFLFGINLARDTDKAKEHSLCSWETGLKTVFVPTAALAAYFYVNYAKLCLQNTECQQLVSFIPGENAQFWTLVASGGSGFAFTNMYFAAKGATALMDFANTERSRFKTAVTIAMPLYVALQVASVFFASLGAKNAEIMSKEVLFPTISIIPTAIYAGINAANSLQARYYMSEFRYALSNIYEICIPARSDLEKEKRLATQHLRTEFRKMQRRIENAIADFISRPMDTLMDLSDEDIKQTIMEHIKRMSDEEKSAFLTAFNSLATLTGVANATTFVGAIVANTYIQTPRMGEWAEGEMQIINTFILGLISSLPNYELAVPAVTTLLGLFAFRAPQSLDLTLHRGRTLSIATLGVATQLMSFAAIDILFDSIYPDDYPIKDELRMAARMGIVLYHIAGFTKVGLALTRTACSNMISRTAEHVGDVYDKLYYTTFNTFCDTSNQELHNMGVTFSEEAQVQEPENGAVVTPTQPPSSFFGSICSFFHCDKRGKQARSFPEEEYKYQPPGALNSLN